jgi:hypothetical protein
MADAQTDLPAGDEVPIEEPTRVEPGPDAGTEAAEAIAGAPDELVADSMQAPEGSHDVQPAGGEPAQGLTAAPRAAVERLHAAAEERRAAVGKLRDDVAELCEEIRALREQPAALVEELNKMRETLAAAQDQINSRSELRAPATQEVSAPDSWAPEVSNSKLSAPELSTPEDGEPGHPDEAGPSGEGMDRPGLFHLRKRRLP